MLGVTGESPQYGLIGDVAGRKVALDLNQTHRLLDWEFGGLGAFEDLIDEHWGAAIRLDI
jgi:hypothetical protein